MITKEQYEDAKEILEDALQDIETKNKALEENGIETGWEFEDEQALWQLKKDHEAALGFLERAWEQTQVLFPEKPKS